MSNVDHWVRMNGIAYLLERTLNVLKGAIKEGVAAMSPEDRAGVESRHLEWLKYLVEDETAKQKVWRMVNKYSDAILAIPIPQDHTFMRCRCDDKGDIVIQAFVDSAVFEVKALESIAMNYENIEDAGADPPTDLCSKGS